MVKLHLADTKRVIEMFNQFECVIKGPLTERVARFLKSIQDDELTLSRRNRDGDFDSLIKELRYYQKLSR
jgi:hypothetical protein